MFQDLWYKIQDLYSIFKSLYSFHVFMFSCFHIFNIHIFFRNIIEKHIHRKASFQFKIEILFNWFILIHFNMFNISHFFISFLISVLLCSCVKKSRNWKMVVYIVATIVFTKWITKWNPMSDFNTNICEDCS